MEASAPTTLPTADTPASLPADAAVPTTTFELGLVMAGAVSAGAYTAGVIDFLFEALDNWHDPALQREQLGWPEKQPIHGVQLKTMGGASAGGMCAALTAISILDGSRTRFRKAWVEDIDSSKLLAADDLAKIASLGELQSVLNCEVLNTIAEEAITLPPAIAPWPAWLAKKFDFYLTLTNLNGLTYEVTQVGGSAQRFTDHADRIQFRLLAPDQPVPPPVVAPAADPTAALVTLRARPASELKPAEREAWHTLRLAALATGAFPVALLNRELLFRNNYFDQRPWFYGGLERPGHVQRASSPDETQPPYQQQPAPYLFVDGGVTNNNPLELVRRTLAGSPDGTKQLPSGAAEARHALLLIDPFPSDASAGAYRPLLRSLGVVVPSLYNALRNQARFRSEDLLAALDANKRSRFVISPTRPPDASGRTTPSLACGSVGAFGGFLHQPFREHDYQLGRRNCQQFLRRQFTLTEDNALFANWRTHADFAGLRARFAVVPAGERVPPLSVLAELPVLPLLGSAAVEVPPPPAWASIRLPAAKLEQEIGGLLHDRLGQLLRLLKPYIPTESWWLRTGYNWFVQPKLRDKAHDWTLNFLRQNLDAAGLLEPAPPKKPRWPWS